MCVSFSVKAIFSYWQDLQKPMVVANAHILGISNNPANMYI